MSELPAGWTTRTLGEVSEIVLGKTPRGLEPIERGDVPFFKVGDMNASEGRWMAESRTYVDSSLIDEHRLRLLRRGAVIFPKVGGAIATDKKRLVARPAAVDTNTMAVVAEPDVLRDEYLYYWFESFPLSSIAYGSPLPQINRQGVSALQIPLAPLDEQQRIVEAIEEQFSRLDAGVATLERCVSRAVLLRQSILHHAFAGRLLGRSEPGAGGMSESDVSIWSMARIEDLAAPGPRSITDGPFGSNLKTAHYTNRGPRVIRLQNVGDGVFNDESAHISESHFETLRAHSAEAGDVIIASLGSDLPRACLVPPWLGPAIVKADCIRLRTADQVESRYVMYMLNAPQTRRAVKDLIHGVGRPRLGMRVIRDIEIPNPPPEEQQRIVKAIEEQFSRLDAGVAALKGCLSRAPVLRQAILQHAFTGRLSATTYPRPSR